jgi:hypothetical protein
MLWCEECGCKSETGRGWLGYIAHDPEDREDPVVCTYCPPCAERHLDATHAYLNTVDCFRDRSRELTEAG